MYHYELVHTPITIPKEMNLPAAKSCGTQRDKLKNLLAWSDSKVRAKTQVEREAL